MKIYIIMNSGETVLAAVDTKEQADALIKLGLDKWKEDWYIEEQELNKIKQWLYKKDEDSAEYELIPNVQYDWMPVYRKVE